MKSERLHAHPDVNGYVAIVFATYAQALYALEKLWDMNRRGVVTLHAAAIVHRDAAGNYEVVKKFAFPGLRTLVGASVGALIGLLAGPAGMGPGAYAGAVVGGGADILKSGEQREAADEVEPGLQPNEAAIVAEISEKNGSQLEATMRDLHGRVFRRSKSDLQEQFFIPPD